MVVGSMTEDIRRALRAEVDGIKVTMESLLAAEKENIDARNATMVDQQVKMREYIELKERELAEKAASVENTKAVVSGQFE